jgi:uncharacterized protein YceK
MSLITLGRRAALMLALLLCLVLSGCATRWVDDGRGPANELTNRCETHQGVLGLIVKPSSQISGTLPSHFYQLDRGELVTALMESGCFSDVRFRRSVSQRGHHVTYSGTTHLDDPSKFNALFSVFTAFVIPMRYDGRYGQNITFYYHGEKQSSDSESYNYQQYLSAIPLSNTLKTDAFSRRESRRLAAAIVDTIASGAAPE